MPVETGPDRQAGSAQASRKRNAPWEGYSGDRLGKRRSSKACLSCRSRKVRCDVVNGGVPCTNCRLDELDCVLKESNRGRKPGSVTRPRVPAAVMSPQPSIRVASAQESEREQPRQTQQSEQPEPSRQSNPSPCDQSLGSPDEYLASLGAPGRSRNFDNDEHDQLPNEDEEMENIDIRTPRQSQHGRRQGSTDRTPSSLAARDGQHGTPPQTAEAPRGEAPSCLPSYIRPVPRHLDAKDINYLTEKRCLEIPDVEFRDELLRVFITIVYPFIPAIELEDLVDSVHRRNSGKPVSLLLFQSIMFVSIAFVDIEFLQTRGYSSRKLARKAFFDRVRILHGINYEADRLALVQSLLLMTYWYDCPDDDQDTWYWMGIAVTKAHVIGLHRSPDQLNISPQEKRLRRRIWWCCIMRDRMLALTIRQPPRIRDNEYSVKALSLDDFDISTPSSTLANLFKNSKFTCPDSHEQRILAKMCVELTRLCLILGRLLRVVYTVMGSYQGGSEYLLTGAAGPKRSQEQERILKKCAADLETWREQQDDNSRYAIGSHESSSHTMESSEKQKLARFHQAQLYLIYLITMGTFHRPQLYCGTPDRSSSCLNKEPPKDHTVADLTKLGFDLQRNNQIRYMSTIAVPAFFSVTVVHLLDTRSNDEETRNLSLGRLYQCVHVLHQLQEMYSSADYAIHFINSILRTNNSGLQAASLFMNVSFGKVEGEWKSRTEPKSMDMGPSRVAVACMYPSPSDSGNFDMSSADSEEMSAEDSVSGTVRQQPTPLSNTLESWASAGGAEPCSIQLHHDSIAGASFTDTWCEVDNFLPELMSFEDDAGAFLAGDASVSLS
ncbi:unnamed protein product [Clonostachys rhizophaga]|uniref:Zn(2)-C6 fungal-type domain-containing protein n=1 Tax=Clonostachys rhizophaga TaxID=160324 RepID=A0A9N9VWR2_9HYPO|nr:unnamed protein product [Clonostachys rhizophaga]